MPYLPLRAITCRESRPSLSTSGGPGYLLKLNSQTLAPIARVRLKDPKSGADASLSDNGTAYQDLAEAFVSDWQAGKVNNLDRGLRKLDDAINQALGE